MRQLVERRSSSSWRRRQESLPSPPLSTSWHPPPPNARSADAPPLTDSRANPCRHCRVPEVAESGRPWDASLARGVYLGPTPSTCRTLDGAIDAFHHCGRTYHFVGSANPLDLAVANLWSISCRQLVELATFGSRWLGDRVIGRLSVVAAKCSVLVCTGEQISGERCLLYALVVCIVKQYIKLYTSS